MHSDVANLSYEGTLNLTIEGNVVTGVMDAPQSGDKSGVEGFYVNDSLTLSRDTGAKTKTTQEYHLTGSGDRLSGTFQNVGVYADHGTFEIYR